MKDLTVSFLRAVEQCWPVDTKAQKQSVIWFLTKQINFCEEEAALKFSVALG